MGFFVAQALALTVGLLSLWPLARMDESDHVGPDVALSLLSSDVQIGPGRGPILVRDADVRGFAAASPNFWFIARANGRELRFGRIPDDLSGILPLTYRIKTGELAEIGGTGLAGEASIKRVESEGGLLTLATGGVDPRSVTFWAWLTYAYREGYLLAPFVVAAFTLIGALAAIPIIVRSIGPTARAAAALNPSDLHGRLPDRKVVREMLPLVEAVNGALDRLTEAFERRKLFIADVAHELRTPLAILTLHVEALPEGQARTDLQRTVYRLGQMVGQMLDAERLASGARRKEQIDLVALGRESLANIAPIAVADGYTLSFTSEAPQQFVSGDPHAVSRAFANLLGNAVAHGGGGGTIELRVGKDGGVEVADEGPGLAVEARERIFEPFRREQWDRDGCGLGLHLVREIMHAHQGEAAVVPSQNGAVFRLTFPQEQIAAA